MVVNIQSRFIIEHYQQLHCYCSYILSRATSLSVLFMPSSIYPLQIKPLLLLLSLLQPKQYSSAVTSPIYTDKNVQFCLV